MEKQPRSNFVNGLAWTTIIFGGLGTLYALIQTIIVGVVYSENHFTEMFSQFPEGAAPPFVTSVIKYLPFFMVSFLLWNGAAFASAIALLMRKEWARKTFIAILASNILVILIGVYLQYGFIEDLFTENFPAGNFPDEELDYMGPLAFQRQIMNFTYIVASIGVLFFALIIYKLGTPAIRNEFSEGNVATKSEPPPRGQEWRNK